MALNVAALVRLMLVLDDQLVQGRDLASLCQAAERGGVTSILVRLRKLTPRELAAAVRAVLGAVRVPVMVNDRADVAIACGAAGVQLGPDDVPLQVIRRIAPQGFIIGAAVGSIAEVENGRGADYWAVGPLRTTGAKPDGGDALGLEGFQAMVRRGEGRLCIAAGGLIPQDVGPVLRVGGAGVAVGSGILAGPDIESAAKGYGY